MSSKTDIYEDQLKQFGVTLTTFREYQRIRESVPPKERRVMDRESVVLLCLAVYIYIIYKMVRTQSNQNRRENRR